jgi:hypothetical protein
MKLRNKLILVAIITVLSVGANAAVIVTGAGNDTTGFSVATNDLLQTQLSSTTNNLSGSGENVHTGSGPGVDVGTVGNLTDGLFQIFNDDASPNGARKSYAISGGNIIYNLDTTTNTQGYDISSIGIYTGWQDNGRDGINVTVSYATVAFPMTFVDIATATQESAGRYESAVITESISPNLLATGVKSIKFTFLAQENGAVGYKELDVVGVATIPEPSSMVLLGLAGIGLISRRRRTA